MPEWQQTVVGIAVFVAAVIALTKVWRSTAKITAQWEDIWPVIVSLSDEMKGIPDIFKILKAQATEFRSDSGSTLKDAINRLEALAQEQNEAMLKIEKTIKAQGHAQTNVAEELEVAKILAATDTERLVKLLGLAVAGQLTTEEISRNLKESSSESKVA